MKRLAAVNDEATSGSFDERRLRRFVDDGEQRASISLLLFEPVAGLVALTAAVSPGWRD